MMILVMGMVLANARHSTVLIMKFHEHGVFQV
eukprot:CAMPEP_0175939758 /NCGR_PEP_ID=MMETSP0108-20121206/23436_1 /TAXON_ID=195067 ORGANISM="Goniomonas pacifica, Strain CCMP1869" /NCGR_SAMPLE_ID=MMETSP0108 /ASSEMBLY_ACC=CAM_ASM_000204 /LENGTH=31 /DNA_ID= /DNA_START= /DNA_END= /DNA_ORIENTATION=